MRKKRFFVDLWKQNKKFSQKISARDPGVGVLMGECLEDLKGFCWIMSSAATHHHFCFSDCECKPEGSNSVNCDNKTGVCTDCKKNVVGPKCNECEENYYKWPECSGIN